MYITKDNILIDLLKDSMFFQLSLESLVKMYGTTIIESLKNVDKLIRVNGDNKEVDLAEPIDILSNHVLYTSDKTQLEELAEKGYVMKSNKRHFDLHKGLKLDLDIVFTGNEQANTIYDYLLGKEE